MGRFMAAIAAPLILSAALLLCLPHPCQAQAVMWRTVRADRVIVHHSVLLPDGEIRALIDISGKARKKVETHLGLTLTERLEMRVYPDTPEFIASTGAAWWQAAVWKDGLLHIQAPHVLAERGALATTITHEYVHLATSLITPAELPDWFDEGLAAQISGEFADQVQGREWEFVWRGQLKDLRQALYEKDKQARAQSAYRGVYLMVRELESGFSRQGLLDFLKDLKNDSVFDVVFEKRFKTTPSRFLASLQKKYPLQKKNH